MPQSASASHLRRSTLVFAGCVAILTLLAWAPLKEAAKLALSNPEHSYTLLVIPIAIGFAFKRPSKQSGEEKGVLTPALVLALLSVALTVLALSRSFADPTVALSLKVFAYVVAIWATFLLSFGSLGFRSHLFALGILILLVPPPESALRGIVWFLQAGSTQVAYSLFQLFHLPVTRKGVVLFLPTLEIEVARECSGIQSTAMLFLLALVLAQLFLRNWRSKALLVFSVVFIGVLRNGLRVFVLSYLGEYVDQSWLDGDLHHHGGILFFVLGLGALVGVLYALWWSEQNVNLAPARTLVGERRD
jgi:exosortase